MDCSNCPKDGQEGNFYSPDGQAPACPPVSTSYPSITLNAAAANDEEFIEGLALDQTVCLWSHITETDTFVDGHLSGSKAFSLQQPVPGEPKTVTSKVSGSGEVAQVSVILRLE